MEHETLEDRLSIFFLFAATICSSCNEQCLAHLQVLVRDFPETISTLSGPVPALSNI